MEMRFAKLGLRLAALVLVVTIIGAASALHAFQNPKLVIYKSQRRLEVHEGKVIAKSYPIVLGFDPNGTKTKQGDGKTPEGDYLLVVKNPNSAFYRSIGLNYPAKPDAVRGLKDGLIDAKQKKSIDQAANAGRLPPQNTQLGGEIFIHGGGIGWDWTRGCIALKNEDMKELYEGLPEGTPVSILP